MKILCIATLDKTGTPTSLPPFQAEREGDPQLWHDFDKDGVPHAGGYSRVGETPPSTGVPSQMFWVEVDAKAADAMRTTCVVLEVLPDKDNPKPAEEKPQEAVVSWLTENWTAAKVGLPPTDAAKLDAQIASVAKEAPKDALAAKRVVLSAHAVTPEQWQVAGGTL